MATATKQLEAIYREITERFSQNSVITVSPIDGDPPEKYEVTYQVTGVFQDESGDIQETNTHKITISIPFGFPHFPPSCKPKTPIFHPDFDPAAICIGDFWEKDRSIADLIQHIGEMIVGNSYSTSNAFNEAAAKWYQENSSRLPFDSLTDRAEAGAGDSGELPDLELEPVDEDDITLLLDEEDEEAPIDLDFSPAGDGGPPAMEAAEPEPEESGDGGGEPGGIDTLDDSFLEADLDFLGTDQGEPETEEIVPPEPEAGGDLEASGPDVDRLRLMARQKRFFELDQELAELAEHHDFKGREELAATAATALQQARERYNEGADFEHQGSPGKALAAFEQVAAIVSDYPGLADDIERTRQARELLGDWAETPSPGDEEDAADQARADELQPPPIEEEPVAKPKSGSRTFFEDAARKTSRLIPFAVGIAVLLVIGTAVAYYFINGATLERAREKLATCRTVLEQNRFTEAERQCEGALDIARRVQYFKSGERDQLIEEISQVLTSQQLTEGLAGNLFLDGKYLPKEVVKTVQAFRYFMEEGDKHFAARDWQQAATSYRQALDQAEQQEGVDPKLVFEVTENLKIAQFRVLFRSGVELIDLEKWVMATEDLNQALELVRDLNLENKTALINEISQKLAAIAFATAREQGDTAFAAGNWKEALGHYQQALASAKNNQATDSATLDQLNQLVIKAQLYDTINTGKQAFTDSNWDLAISSYQQAIEILEANREILKQASTPENRQKLARVMLQASVIRDKQEAARHLKQKEYEQAIAKLQSIIDSIKASEFGAETEFSAVVADTEKAIEEARTDLLLEGKIEYLEENFEELFTANYTVASPEMLTDRKVIFEKQMGDQLLFQLQCVEIGRGRPLRLIMKYVHDLKTGTWSFYGTTQ